MKKRRLFKLIATTLTFSSLFTFASLADWEQQTDGGWRYKDDATQQYVVSKWIESKTEKGLWYYIGADGVMFVNTTTPDGYWVNELGEWREALTDTSNNSDSDSSNVGEKRIHWIPDDVTGGTDAGWGVDGVKVGG